MQSCEHESCERIYRFYVCTAKKSEGPDVMINFSCHKKTYSCMFDIQPAQQQRFTMIDFHGSMTQKTP